MSGATHTSTQRTKPNREKKRQQLNRGPNGMRCHCSRVNIIYHSAAAAKKKIQTNEAMQQSRAPAVHIFRLMRARATRSQAWRRRKDYSDFMFLFRRVGASITVKTMVLVVRVDVVAILFAGSRCHKANA